MSEEEKFILGSLTQSITDLRESVKSLQISIRDLEIWKNRVMGASIVISGLVAILVSLLKNGR